MKSQLEVKPLQTSTSPTIACTVVQSGSLPASISDVPNELLTAIFFAGCEDRSLSLRSKELPFEILITQVSYHWRIVAHSTPQLWTNVVIDTQDENHLKNATEYVQRSRALTLNVFVHVPYHGQLPLTFPSICRLLSTEVERLQVLRVESNLAGFPSLQYAFGHIAKSAPHLQALDIRLSGERNIMPHVGLQETIFPDGLPSLQSLHLVGVTLRNTVLPQCPITSLQLHQCAYYHSSFRGADHPFSALTQLVLSELNWMCEWGSDPIQLPLLKGLYVRYLSDYDKILSRIVAPELDTLYLEAVDEGEMADIISASQSPEYNSDSSKFPRLHSFILRLAAGRTLSPQIWRNFMGRFHEVTHFTLLDANIGDFLQALGDPDALCVPWPMLEMLSLPNIETGLLADTMSVVSKRADMGYPILKLQLSPKIFADADIFWRDRGVYVEAVVNPLAALPAACHTEEWRDDEK